MNSRQSICQPDAIARLVQSGDPDALHRIATCYLDHLLQVGRCACRDADSAQDAVHDALITAAERLDQFRGDGSVQAWLSRMVTNACHCQRRGRKNDPAWNRPLHDEHAAAAAGPRESAARAELAGYLGRALATLEPRDRALFVLTQVDGFSAPEVARSFDASADAVRARLTRIRRRLRAELAAVWRELGDAGAKLAAHDG